MTALYHIKDWDRHFEKAENRRTKRMSWVAIPNKHDGRSFRRLSRHARAAEIFAAWVLMVQVASKAPVRGALVGDDGPLDALSLSDMTGFPEAIFALAFEVLSAPAINWLTAEESAGQIEESAGQKAKPAGQIAISAGHPRTCPAETCERPAETCESPTYRQDRTGQDRTGHTRGASSAPLRPADEDPSQDPTLPPSPRELTDDEIIRSLTPHLYLRYGDPARTAEAREIALYLVRTHGLAACSQAWDAAHKSKRDRLYPEEFEPAVNERVAPAEPAPALGAEFSLDAMAGAYHVIAQARAIITTRGWQWARDLWKYPPGKVETEAAVLEILRTDITASECVVAAVAKAAQA